MHGGGWFALLAKRSKNRNVVIFIYIYYMSMLCRFYGTFAYNGTHFSCKFNPLNLHTYRNALPRILLILHSVCTLMWEMYVFWFALHRCHTTSHFHATSTKNLLKSNHCINSYTKCYVRMFIMVETIWHWH